MQLNSALLLIALMILAVGCGNKRSPNSGIKYHKLTEEQIRLVMDNQIIECASLDNKACPQGMARILTLNKEQAEKSSFCSGFMVDKTTLVTNHHCVNTELDCSNTYIVVYDGHSYVQTRCKNIINSKEDFQSARDPRRAIDYTVMEVTDAFAGETFKISDTRATAYDNVTAWVIDHTGLDNKSNPNPFEFRITEFACNVANQTQSRSLMLNNCPVVSGNSGSPAVNAAGRIVGVIWGATALTINTSYDLESRRDLDDQAAVTEMHHFAPYVP